MSSEMVDILAVYRRGMPERCFTFVRHASTVYNDFHLLNGDPRVPVALDAEGRVAAVALGARLRHCRFDLALHTRFARTRETLMLMLGRRHRVPVAVEAAFDDIDVGIFEGRDVDAYRAWRAEHGPGEAVPGGESRLDALARYADGCARVLARRDAHCVLLVVHDVPIRFLHNALLAADPLEGPVRTVANLERLSVGEPQLAAGLAVMRRRLSGLPPV
jgi:broad specificity phosphatase PhoE